MRGLGSVANDCLKRIFLVSQLGFFVVCNIALSGHDVIYFFLLLPAFSISLRTQIAKWNVSLKSGVTNCGWKLDKCGISSFVLNTNTMINAGNVELAVWSLHSTDTPLWFFFLTSEMSEKMCKCSKKILKNYNAICTSTKFI